MEIVRRQSEPVYLGKNRVKRYETGLLPFMPSNTGDILITPTQECCFQVGGRKTLASDPGLRRRRSPPPHVGILRIPLAKLGEICRRIRTERLAGLQHNAPRRRGKASGRMCLVDGHIFTGQPLDYMPAVASERCTNSEPMKLTAAIGVSPLCVAKRGEVSGVRQVSASQFSTCWCQDAWRRSLPRR